MSNLKALARVHKTEVADMIAQSRLVGSDGEEWQQRVVRLADRLAKLEGLAK